MRKEFHSFIIEEKEKCFDKGGQAYPSDIIDLTKKVFDKDRKSGVLALHFLKPEKMSSSEYGAYLLF